MASRTPLLPGVSELVETTGGDSLAASPTPNPSSTIESNNKKELWSTVQIMPTLPYFGGFVQVLSTPRTPAYLLRFQVFPPYASEPGKPHVVNTWPRSRLEYRDPPYLKMIMGKWPVLPPSANSPWYERWFSKKVYTGFYVHANFIAYVDTPRPLTEIKESIDVRGVNIFLYYALNKDGRGCLYWSEEKSETLNSMPLDSISAVHVGLQGPILLSSSLNREIIRDLCLSIESLNGQILNLNCGSSQQRHQWLRRLWYIQTQSGRSCVAVPASATTILTTVSTVTSL